jgi:TetR/AcrR family transcriptional regulator, transcriptional repressor for nem operon
MKDTRDHIINVSFGLFLQKSYKEVTMKEIVEKTGLSKGAFYHYFDSKEQIYLEIINQAFSSLIYVDYNKFSKTSLYNFYHDYIDYLNRVYDSFKRSCNGDSFDLNYYSLIFDALRLFPEFKEKVIESSKQELDSWRTIIQVARENGEIKSSMNDEEIAGIFVHTNSGIGMNNMMIGKSETTTGILIELWDSFYLQIKA